MDDQTPVLDLDLERSQRAAAREGKQIELPIIIGGETIAVLPVELPLDVLEPLRVLDEDLTIILREAVQSAKGQRSQEEATDLVIDMLAANPALPVTVLNTASKVATNLLGESGFDKFKKSRPSPQDVSALAKGVFRFYGVSLGEAFSSSDSSTNGGGTSQQISSESTGSTSEGSTPTLPVAPEDQSSLESAGSTSG